MPTNETMPSPSTNGSTPLRDEIEQRLTAVYTHGYTPSLPLWAVFTDVSYMPQIYILRDIELMMTHPMVRAPLDYYKGGIAGAEFESEASSPEIQAEGDAMCRRFWDYDMPKVQGGYEYGWIGLEPIYEYKPGGLGYRELAQFSPRDVFLLTAAHAPVGVRVKNVQDVGSVDLLLATEDVPAKGLWYAHRPRYSQWYGQSQLLPAWRPWRRLAWKDAAESVTDMGVYRYGVPPAIVSYPEEDLQVSGTNAPGTTLDSQGRPRRYARDLARFIAEQLHSGSGIGLPSTPYPQEQGGKNKWDVKFPEMTLNVDGLIAYVKYLQDQISYGIGVPPELLQAADTGSGYSGRKLPVEAFLMQQQAIASAILKMFVEQVVKPLIRWNYGPSAQYNAKIKNILKETRQAATGATTAAEPGSVGTEERPNQTPGPVSPTGAPTPAGTSFSLEDARARVLAIARRIQESIAA